MNLAMVARARGDLDECETIMRDVLAIRRRVCGDAHEGTLQAISSLGSAAARA